MKICSNCKEQKSIEYFPKNKSKNDGRQPYCNVCYKVVLGRWVKSRPGYGSWRAMKRRCYDPNATRYLDWGGRGIKVCDRWLNSYSNFIEDLGLPPRGYSLDRIDPNGDYEPDNVRWASPKEQANNRRKY